MRVMHQGTGFLFEWSDVCAGGARVIQIGGGTRDLYYYPKDTVLVTAISPKLKKGMSAVYWACKKCGYSI